MQSVSSAAMRGEAASVASASPRCLDSSTRCRRRAPRLPRLPVRLGASVRYLISSAGPRCRLARALPLEPTLQ
ncbi:hypothetical protein M885DRAFT_546174 [Pelagophyceae sp. CCMP2097]|nr:hypothetical protein M885DRAFT_546174 [Pelagophyceae sp. CCMP2097]